MLVTVFCQISGQISSLALRMSVFELKAPLSHSTRLLVSCFIISMEKLVVISVKFLLESFISSLFFLLAKQNVQNIELIVSLNSENSQFV